jgi:sigma-B regulation protein RsbU (phosphoserine phosphatase)
MREVSGNTKTRRRQVESRENPACNKAIASSLTEQLRMAGQVQRDFLPSQLPDNNRLRWAAIFLPAECVSGDIYDIARLDEQHIGFYIADVVGHGMPAALLTIFIKQALVMRQTSGSSYRIFSPAEVIANLNSRMTDQKFSGNRFATCCYCLLNTATFELTHARGGHPYPILIRPHKNPQRLEAQGSLLGVFENATYNQQTIQLHPCDKLLLYSDGAEPFIGTFDDTGGFNLTEDFRRLTHLPIAEMMEKFNQLVQNRRLKTSGADSTRVSTELSRMSSPQVDDITVVGLEIL